jgi:hypothetical protein
MVVSALGERAQIVAEYDHNALQFLPVDGARAVVAEGAPEVLAFVPAQVIHAGAGIGVNGASVRCGWLGGPAVQDVEFGAELALGFGGSGSRPGGSGMFEEGGAVEEGVDVDLSLEQVGEEFDIKRFCGIS